MEILQGVWKQHLRPPTVVGSNNESMVALATSSLDKNNFIHFPKMYLSIVVVVPIHLDGRST